MTITIPDWLADRVEVDENGCWLWTRSLTSQGYGQMRWRGTTHRSHRAVYTELVGPIPDGLDIDHLCRVRRCVNPSHLEPVTRRENIRRSPLAGCHNRNDERTECPAGHVYDEENTYRDPRGWRGCKTCRRESVRRSARRLSEFDERVLTVDEIAAEDDALALPPAGVDTETGEVHA